MSFTVDSWDPSYGTSLTADAPERVTKVDAGIEIEPGRWTPIEPSAGARPTATIFVDGVRRIDARIWRSPDRSGAVSADAAVDAGSTESEFEDSAMGLCASYAAGAVCCCESGAHYLPAEFQRSVFTASPTAPDLATRHGTYTAHTVQPKANQDLAVSLSAALQRRLTELELVAAVKARDHLVGHTATDGAELLVVDGPVRGREHLPRVLGFIKTHQIRYLDAAQHSLVARLQAGSRTPVFLIGGSWDRYSWYLRLPGPVHHAWAGVARIECAANVTPTDVVALANLSQAVLPRFASAEYKDPRAPQNLYPIGALESELRRRLGHPALLIRALREAAQAESAGVGNLPGHDGLDDPGS